MLTIKQPHKLFDPAKVADVAAMLKAGDDEGWDYVVKHDPAGTGKSVIEVYDEEGEFVSLL